MSEGIPTGVLYGAGKPLLSVQDRGVMARQEVKLLSWSLNSEHQFYKGLSDLPLPELLFVGREKKHFLSYCF